LRVAKHKYRVKYSPIELGAVGPPPSDFVPEDLMQKSLLERAGLDRNAPRSNEEAEHNVPARRRTSTKRYDILGD
jgi:hypothetical protein